MKINWGALDEVVVTRRSFAPIYNLGSAEGMKSTPFGSASLVALDKRDEENLHQRFRGDPYWRPIAAHYLFLYKEWQERVRRFRGHENVVEDLPDGLGLRQSAYDQYDPFICERLMLNFFCSFPIDTGSGFYVDRFPNPSRANCAFFRFIELEYNGAALEATSEYEGYDLCEEIWLWKYTLRSEQLAKADSFAKKLSYILAEWVNKQSVFQESIDRFESGTSWPRQNEDRLTDYMTSLNALYFPEEAPGISAQLPGRVAVLLGWDERRSDRYKREKKLNEWYELRSKVVHGNPSRRSVNAEEINELRNYTRIAILLALSLRKRCESEYEWVQFCRRLQPILGCDVSDAVLEIIGAAWEEWAPLLSNPDH